MKLRGLQTTKQLPANGLGQRHRLGLPDSKPLTWISWTRMETGKARPRRTGTESGRGTETRISSGSWNRCSCCRCN